MQRSLTAREAVGLSEAQKQYLLAHPSMVSLQPHHPPQDALYLTVRHGAVTIDQSIELDRLHDSYFANQRRIAAIRDRRPSVDHYTSAEDDFICRHGMSSQLD